MPNLLLRTLTRKSNIGFGYFKDWSVGQMIDMCKLKDLLSIYYGCGKIDFCEELKTELKLSENLQVQKPGKGYGMFDRRINMVIFDYVNSLPPDKAAKNRSFVSKMYSANKKQCKAKDIIIGCKYQSKFKNRERNQKH